MPDAFDRRQWFKKAGTAAAGLSVAPAGLATATPPPRRPRPAPEFHPRNVQKRVAEDAPAMLDSNENPHGPAASALDAARDALGQAFRYPGESYRNLVTLIAEREGVTPEHVILGAGSTEVLCMAGLAYGLHGGEIVTGAPSYKGLTSYAANAGAYVDAVPLTDDLTLDLDAMAQRTTASTDLVFVCNPNNPTATLLEDQALRRFIEETSPRALIFMDEAYHELVDDDKRISTVDMVRDGHNLVVSRTFSKIFGMAGMRIGYGIARPDIVARLRPYGMSIPNAIGLEAAAASLRDESFQKESRRKIAEARAFTYDVLDDLSMEYAASQASFVFFRTGRDIRAFEPAMAERGVLVGRPFPPYTEWCRVSMGTMESMNRFAEALRSAVA